MYFIEFVCGSWMLVMLFVKLLLYGAQLSLANEVGTTNMLKFSRGYQIKVLMLVLCFCVLLEVTSLQKYCLIEFN